MSARMAATRKSRPRRQRKTSHAALVRKADAAFSLRVREVSACVSGRADHAGPLQCAHGFSRRYQGTRWDFRNAFCLCAGCHVYFTHRPLEWDEWMRSRMGLGYEVVRLQALNGGKQDMAEVIASIERRVAA